MTKWVKYLAGLGYGSRREVEALLKNGAFETSDGTVLTIDSKVGVDEVRFRGEPLDPPSPLAILMNKPIGFTCSTDDPGETIYELLPPRFRHRHPGLNPAGRLDKDSSGLLILSDEGPLIHRLIHPKSHLAKRYRVGLARAMRGDEAKIFGSGEMMLKSERNPLLPAQLEVISPKEAWITLEEGRYHQVRRMFAAVGNHVDSLERTAIGGLELPVDLAHGDWRVMDAEDFEVLGVRR